MGFKISYISKAEGRCHDPGRSHLYPAAVIRMHDDGEFVYVTLSDGTIHKVDTENQTSQKVEPTKKIGEAVAMMKIEKETMITCPAKDCSRTLYVVIKEITARMIVESNLFEPVLGAPELTNGTVPKCHKCGTAFIEFHQTGFGVKIHTEKGWNGTDGDDEDHEAECCDGGG